MAEEKNPTGLVAQGRGLANLKAVSLNKKALAAGAGALTIVLGYMWLSEPTKHQPQEQQKPAQDQLGVGLPDTISKKGDGVAKSAADEALAAVFGRNKKQQQPLPPSESAALSAVAGANAKNSSAAASAQQPRRMSEEERERMQRLKQAIYAKPVMTAGGMGGFGGPLAAGGAASSPGGPKGSLQRALMAQQKARQEALARAKAAMGATGKKVQAIAQPAAQQPTSAAAMNDYNRDILHPSLSADEVKAGSVIQAVLETGINTDTPSMLRARTTEDIYDSATGTKVLIPKGSVLLGVYHKPKFGDNRIRISWNRIIYPDGRSIQLEKMPGTDASGYGGIAAYDVDNHRAEAFGASTLISLITGGIAVASNQNSNHNSQKPNATETVLNQMLAGWGKLGEEILDRYMDIPPTLTVPPGARVTVMVEKDLILPAS